MLSNNCGYGREHCRRRSLNGRIALALGSERIELGRIPLKYASEVVLLESTVLLLHYLLEQHLEATVQRDAVVHVIGVLIRLDYRFSLSLLHLHVELTHLGFQLRKERIAFEDGTLK